MTPIFSLPFFDDPSELADRLRGMGAVTLLDSGGATAGVDVIAPAPDDELLLRSDATEGDIDAFLEQLMALQTRVLRAGSQRSTEHFCGGLLGFLSYELGRRLVGMTPKRCEEPLALVRHYPWAIVQDRGRRSSGLFAADSDALPPALRAELKERLDGTPPCRDRALITTTFRGAWTKADYAQRFAAVMRYIEAGDCYQVNIGQPFRGPYDGSLWDSFVNLRRVAKAPYSAFFPLQDGAALLCLSPEQFLSVRDRRVETRPIKGTRPRAEDPADDRALADALLNSEKERAENLMIVDLLRNDIGRFCAAGSVQVDELFTVKSYATVHHLVSRVSGELRPEVTPLELLLGCLPGGSITGAPKYRAMQIIDELEPAPRGSWCGSLFSLSHGGAMESNILIRTLHGNGETLTCWAGGGLVADSDPEAEFQELEHKVGAFLRALTGNSSRR